jgi:hypothetical protein
MLRFATPQAQLRRLPGPGFTQHDISKEYIHLEHTNSQVSVSAKS